MVWRLDYGKVSFEVQQEARILFHALAWLQQERMPCILMLTHLEVSHGQ